MTDAPTPPTGSPRWSRRRLLLSGAATAGGAAAVAVGGVAAADDRTDTAVRTALGRARDQADRDRETFVGTDVVDPRGVHQAGITTPSQAHAAFCAFDLRPEVGAVGLQQLLQLLTDDLERITAGRPALGDTAPELAATPARLTVTVGLGPGVFDRIGRPDLRPAGLADVPAFPAIDRLEERWSGGDLLLQVCADDPLTVAHAHRMLLKDTRAFATSRWVQRGFLRARGNGADSTTPRNLMGQVDGTVNPRAQAEFDRVVWHPGRDWFSGGTTLVLRRIRMRMDEWDALDRSAMEQVMGRRLSDGAPLSGGDEHTRVDFDARDATGLRAVPDLSHVRLARGPGPEQQMLRRAYNYDDTPDAEGGSDLGLLFCAFQADIAAQFTPMQQRLADGDMLNEWTTPTGSSSFAVLPGWQGGGHLGEGLFR